MGKVQSGSFVLSNYSRFTRRSGSFGKGMDTSQSCLSQFLGNKSTSLDSFSSFLFLPLMLCFSSPDFPCFSVSLCYSFPSSYPIPVLLWVEQIEWQQGSWNLTMDYGNNQTSNTVGPKMISDENETYTFFLSLGFYS